MPGATTQRAKKGADGKPIRLFRDQTSWETWLAKNHATSMGLWLRIAKKASRFTSVTYDQALEVALCYGWIDSQSKGEDEDFRLQKFTPRSKRSMWSKRNREKAQALIAAGRMRQAGLAEIERAQGDGRWAVAYDSPSTIEVPSDFRAAVDANPRAKAFFETVDGQNRYAMLHRLQIAKKPETRARRIETFVAMLARGEKLHQ